MFQREFYAESQAVVKLEIEALSTEELDVGLHDEEESSSVISEKPTLEKLEERDEVTRAISAKELIAILAPEEKDSIQLGHYEETDYEIVYQSEHYEQIKFAVARCCGCPQIFKDQKELLTHAQTAHKPFREKNNSEKNSSYECPICFQQFSDLCVSGSHRNHIDYERYRCRACDQLLDNREQVVKHLETKHSIELVDENEVDFGAIDSGQYKVTGAGQDYDLVESTGIRCCGCSENFNSREQFEQHSAEVHSPDRIVEDENNPYECSVCFQRFAKKGSLSLHKIRPHMRRIICRLCREIFKSEATFRKHITSAHAVDKDRDAESTRMDIEIDGEPS